MDEKEINHLYNSLLDPFTSYMIGHDQHLFIDQIETIRHRSILVEKLLAYYVAVIKDSSFSQEVNVLSEKYLSGPYTAVLKKNNWAKRINTLHFIEDFKIQSLSTLLLERLCKVKKLDVEAQQLIRTLASLNETSVLDFLRKYPNAPMRLYLDSFSRLDRKLAEQEIEKALAENFIPIKLSAIAFIGTARLLSFRTHVEHELQNTTTEIRIQSLKTLFRLHYMDNPGALEPFFHSDNWAERMFAARIAGVMTLERFKPKLRHLLSDQVWWVRYSAAEAFSYFGDGELLLTYFSENHEDQFARDMAKQWIILKSGGQA
ncbi:HEAT repeat domain-containing protein [Domibacillus mangrovi]|uniref:HEAT repeat domain-containing protein n=1 Tax=Domibacillus mangrovi TaxID=1714354 RepID=UPI001FEABF89|nr:HEAT repeat domain-containing protein [Domibacillus mangrovi]